MYYEKGGPPLLLPHIHCDKHIGMLFDPTIFHDRRVDELSCKPRLRLKGSRSQSQRLYRASHVTPVGIALKALSPLDMHKILFFGLDPGSMNFLKSRSRLVLVSKKNFWSQVGKIHFSPKAKLFSYKTSKNSTILCLEPIKNSISVLANKLARSGSEL